VPHWSEALGLITVLLAFGTIWDLGRRFAARGQQVTREEFLQAQAWIKASQSELADHSAKLGDHTKVLANHAEALKKHGQALTEKALGHIGGRRG